MIYTAIPSLVSANPQTNPEAIANYTGATASGIAAVPGTLTGMGALHRAVEIGLQLVENLVVRRIAQIAKIVILR